MWSFTNKSYFHFFVFAHKDNLAWIKFISLVKWQLDISSSEKTFGTFS